jgi:hypothetical protein
MPVRAKRSKWLPRTAFLLLSLIGILPGKCRAQGFQSASPEELKMTSEPKAPGASAIILFRTVDRDDDIHTPHENNYIRIKILTEEGRKYGDVEIPFNKATEDVVHLHARTIRPDGSIADFSGQLFEKTLVKTQSLRYLAKTFTLPDVQVGAIIEYYYTIDFSEHHLYDSHWILSERLYTRSAKFTLKPYRSEYHPMTVRWSWHGLPPGSEPLQGPDHVVKLEAHDVPAFQLEDFMPPPNELKMRVDFIYESEYTETEPDAFWRHVAKSRNESLERFIGKRKAMEEAVSQIVSPNDAPEVKLRKIYDRVQQIRNKSYEIRKTEQEQKREKEKPDENVEDVWKRGYGRGVQITWLYLALVRAAGFEAYGVWASSRREYFFDPKTMQHRQLNENVVLVKLNGKDLYFDPGAAFTPFGMLTWSETGARALCLDKEGGTWVKTTLPGSSESRIEHTARLKLNESGGLEGQVTMTYTGLEAMYHRLDVRNADDVTRKKFLEDRLRHQVPAAMEAELTKAPDWTNPEIPLVAEFDVSIPGWISSAGKRTLISAALFNGIEKRLFEHADRVHPIYVSYPYEKDDDVTIELPAGWRVGPVPAPHTQDERLVSYSLNVEGDHTTLHLTRKVVWNFLILDQKYYPALRNFFQMARTTDEQQIMLLPPGTQAGN